MKRLIFFLGILLNYPVQAQNENYSHHSSWNTLIVQTDISENLFAKTEFNFRRTNFLQDWEQIVLRPSFQYRALPQITVALGYTFIQNYSYSDFSSPLDTRENNLWQQLLIDQTFGRFNISHRVRFEERLKNYIDMASDKPQISGNDYSGRLRYRFIVTVPVLKKQRVSILAYDEAFLDFGKGTLPKTLDQNWIFIGVRLRESDHVTIKSGYHQINIPGTEKSVTNHIWETTLIFTI